MSESAGNNVVNMEDERKRLENLKKNAKKWGKKDIFAGAEKVENEYFERVDAIIPIRRLTTGQWEEIEELQSGGVTLSGTPPQNNRDSGPRANQMSGMKMDINISESVSSERRAKILAVSYGIADGEEWSVDDVRAIPNPGLVDDIAGRIFHISGVRSDAQEAIQNFREEQRGGESGVHNDSGVSSGEESSGADASATDVSNDSSSTDGDA